MRCIPVLAVLALVAAPALAGFSDTDAAKMAEASPAVARSMGVIESAVKVLPADLRDETRAALLSNGGCIAYRRGETPESQKQVVDALIAQGFASDATALARSLYGYPVRKDAQCSHMVAPFLATPGSEENSHHSWPGGLADHIAFNLNEANDLVARYRDVTGEPHAFDTGTLDAAVLWHDWAKRLLLHWSDDGVVSYESPIGGTASHHVIGLAEAMARGIAAREILIQVCAHQAPATDHDTKVAGWIRAAAIIAHVDPVKNGYLDAAGVLTVTPECRIHNLSDGNWVYAVPAAEHAKKVIAKLGPSFGVKADDERFMLKALSTYGAERFDLISDDEASKLLHDLQTKPANH